MINRSEHLSIEEALGFLPAQNEQTPSLLRISVDMEDLVRIVSHWSSLDADQLPILNGITVSPGDDSRIFLNLLIDRGGGEKVLCLEADLPRDRVLPDLSLVWSYAAWWQEELAVFFDVRFERKKAGEGIQWRRA